MMDYILHNALFRFDISSYYLNSHQDYLKADGN